MNRKYIIFIFVFVFLFSSFVSVIAQTTEVAYPDIDGYAPDTVEGSFPLYVRYIAQFLIFLGVLLAVFSLVRGGFLWISSSGDPAKIKDSKEKISAAVLGLIIVLGASFFLSSINPSLTDLGGEDELKDKVRQSIVQEVYPPGIYLSKINIDNKSTDDLEKMIHDENPDVIRIMNSIRNLEDKGEGINSIRVVNQTDRQGNLIGFYYALILHEKAGFQGKCHVIVSNEREKTFNVSNVGSFSSVTLVQISEDPPDHEGVIVGGVNLYAHPDFRGEKDELEIATINNNFNFLPLNNTTQSVWSIEVIKRNPDQRGMQEEGRFAVILSSGDTWENSERCSVFLDSRTIPDLKMHHMNKCDEQTHMPIFSAYRSCATHYMVLPLYREFMIFDYIKEETAL